MLKSVICIIGSGRSGSTILDRTLGAVEGVESFNEMNVILQPSWLEKQVCSCGEDREDCPFWVPVFEELSHRHDLERMRRLAERFDRSAAAPRMMFGLYWGRSRQDLKAYAAFTHDLFEVLARQAGADTIVDSSKMPTRPILLKKYSKLPVYTVHLTRHPVAVAASWQRKKSDPSLGDEAMIRYSLNRTLLVWVLRQIASSLARFWTPYIHLHYEHFSASPKPHTEKIMAFVPNLSGRKSGFVSDKEVDLPPFHSLLGNPDRFTSGVTEIREDKKWQSTGLSKQLGLRRILVAPFAWMYGYRI